MIRGKLLAAAAGVMALGLANPASAAGFINGSFETNCGVAAGSFATIVPGNSCITGWSVGPHSVDLINGYWEAKDGTHSIDLAGNGPGSISQTFDTVVGGLYTVNYWLSGNPDGGDLAKYGLITAVDGGVIASSNFLGLQGATRDNMGYAPWSFAFTATGSQTTLTFEADPTEGFYGPVLDAVEVIAPVPEPSTWATMLLGFGLIGFGLRKRKAASQNARLRVAYI